MVSEEELKNYLQAARIHTAAEEVALGVVKEGAGVLSAADAIEKEIVEAGGKTAFPVNISFDSEAAHNTPVANDQRVFAKEVVKVDIGVHVEGCIIDAGFTIDLSGENGKLVEATEQALKDALSVMRAGVKARDVGAVIEKTIRSKGFKPVENLTGHLLEPYNLHAGIEVPNVAKGGEHVFEEGEVFAVEPFASTGAGFVADGPAPAEIFSIIALKNVRMQRSREFLHEVFEERQLLPFAKRWFAGEKMIDFTLRDLARQGVLHDYPILIDESKGLVSQSESTVIIEKDSVKVLV
ncbi:type II methionyl aminopeptidase [Candidatus Micrarchaeota archaeon]|nr:type II methionyl aminopeptidase [Candidatus Micrarchaeota archaeon]